MKKAIKLFSFALVGIMLIMSLCSCLKVKNFALGLINKAGETIDKDNDGVSGQGILAGDDGSTNRKSRIDGARSKAANTQMAYNSNRQLDAGFDVQPEGTKYVVDCNGFFVEFTIVNGNLTDTNPEVLPKMDPYKNDKNYYQATRFTDNIRNDTVIYLPKGTE